MLSRLAKWAAPAIFGVFVTAAPAQAITFISPGGTYTLIPIETYTYTQLLTGGQVIGTPHGFPVPAGNVFEFFVAPASLGTITTSISLNQDGSGGLGVANLVATWYNALSAPISSLTVTNASGVVINTSLALTLFSPGPYYLGVVGTALASGGIYNIGVQTGPAGVGGEVPLPPAVILFGSALVGLAMLKRRRSRRAAQFAAA